MKNIRLFSQTFFPWLFGSVHYMLKFWYTGSILLRSLNSPPSRSMLVKFFSCLDKHLSGRGHNGIAPVFWWQTDTSVRRLIQTVFKHMGAVMKYQFNMCVCVMCACAHTYTERCMCVWGESDLICLMWSSVHFVFKVRVSHWTRSMPVQLDWPSSYLHS